MQATRAVRGERRGRREVVVRVGFVVVGEEEGEGDGDGDHHFMVRFWEWARRIQGEMLASWSRVERMSSESGGKWRVWARLAKRRVVEGPITGKGRGVFSLGCWVPIEGLKVCRLG